ncbi:uncharacterized protein yc1106_09754 [Curvularia clavata]|uniref:Uncharacterized protein n=1 Tax=Curvularia clavata TaxID=95742 RepID=A0A9Q9DXZ3_CURCL|nr:uncharacterized protein yc1106_09754 [Curvularia clavata]
MADRIWDQPALLTTAPIFDDAVYSSEALALPVNQSEDDLDAELVLQARQSGIHDPYRFVPSPAVVSRAMSTMTLDSDQTSSRSMHSQETQSTGFTAPSHASRDHVYSTDYMSAKRAPPLLAHVSPSLENHQLSVERTECFLQSTRSSDLSNRSSVSSNLSSSHQEQSRKKRGSALFSMLRKEAKQFATTGLHSRVATSYSYSCPSPLHHNPHGKSPSTESVCGHCGNTLGRSLPKNAATKAEKKSHSKSNSQVSVVSPDRPSPPKTPDLSETSLAQADVPARRARHEPINIDSALAQEAFKSFKVQQKEQWERVSTFECVQRKALAAHYRNELERLQVQYEARQSERIKQHASDLDRLEERQVLAEHDLLETQAQEAQNVATALKYIEAYCLGNSTSQERTHNVTEEDFKKLYRQKMLQQDLPRKHASAISVLRARQEVDYKRRLETHEAELRQLEADLKKAESTKEAEYKKEQEQLEALIETRRKRLQQRWDLRFEMWRLDWETQHNTSLTDKLEHEEWPPRKADHVIVIPDASALAQYIKAAA